MTADRFEAVAERTRYSYSEEAIILLYFVQIVALPWNYNPKQLTSGGVADTTTAS